MRVYQFRQFRVWYADIKFAGKLAQCQQLKKVALCATFFMIIYSKAMGIPHYKTGDFLGNLVS